jgi:hypothetical protein
MFKVATSNHFDSFISLCVGINTIGLCVEYQSAPDWYKNMLE